MIYIKLNFCCCYLITAIYVYTFKYMKIIQWKAKAKTKAQ